jgi:hypothetical protein
MSGENGGTVKLTVGRFMVKTGSTVDHWNSTSVLETQRLRSPHPRANLSALQVWGNDFHPSSGVGEKRIPAPGLLSGQDPKIRSS